MLSAVAEPGSLHTKIVSANSAMPAPVALHTVSAAESAGPTATLQPFTFVTADGAIMLPPTVIMAVDHAGALLL